MSPRRIVAIDQLAHVAVELVRLHLSDRAVALQLLELQRRAYSVEAALIGSSEIPPLRETLVELQACDETFLGAILGGDLAGAVSWRVDGETIDLHRLVVEPSQSRKGIGTALLHGALSAEPQARHAVVQTGAANVPALTLYRRARFGVIAEFEPVPGLRVTRLAKSLR